MIDTATRRAQLQRLLDQAAAITIRDSNDPTFKTWKNTVERTLIRLFGEKSPEVQQFHKLKFFYSPVVMVLGTDHTREHRECFDRDFQILVSSIASYIEELGPEPIQESSPTAADGAIRRVFISHASGDVKLAEELVDLLEVVGVPGDSIFCTSLAGYGIPLGENFLDAIRDQLRGNTLVIFLITQKFFSSAVSLCEMGAVWVLAKDHIPVVVPPLDFADVKGVLPLTQGLRLNDPLQLNQLKQKMESVFGLAQPIAQSAWERKRDRALERIGKAIGQ